MGCPGCCGPDDLAGDRQVEADDAILEQTDAVDSAELRDRRSEGAEQEASRALGGLDRLPSSIVTRPAHGSPGPGTAR